MTWVVERSRTTGHVTVVETDSEPRMVCRVSRNADANARLIAAAPYLLEACEAEERVDEHWRTCVECEVDGQCCEVQDAMISDARRLRRNALEKARKP